MSEFKAYFSKWIVRLRQSGLIQKINPALKYFKRAVNRKHFRSNFISNDFGCVRGTPVDRYYLHQFTSEHCGYIRGSCLEFGFSEYIDKYGKGVTDSSVFNYSETYSRSESDIRGDIVKNETLPREEFNCIVCFGVLNFIYDLSSAILGLKWMLKPDGNILLSLAGVTTHISRHDMDRWGDYWRLTDKAVLRLAGDAGFNVAQMRVYGNPYACTSQLNGYCFEDLDEAQLLPNHPDYQLLIAFVLNKVRT